MINDRSDSTGKNEVWPDFGPGSDDFNFSSESRQKSHWSVAWSDLMMTMFILFVILYVVQETNLNLRVSRDSAIGMTFDRSDQKSFIINRNNPDATELYKVAKQILLDEFITASRVDLIEGKAVRIGISADLFFDLGRTDLKFSAKAQLDQIGRLLFENNLFVNVVGHTDDLPTNSNQYPTNWELSTARACQVARYLIDNAGIAENRFFITGHSSQIPLKSNDSSVNRSLNRRVELILVREIPYITETNRRIIPGRDYNNEI